MAIQASIRSQQTVKVNVTAPDGTNTLYITTGLADFNLVVSLDPPGPASQQGTFAVLLPEPTLAAAQFRRAIATASLASLWYQATDPAQATGLEWSLSNVEADFDDESGRIELRFDVWLSVQGSGTSGTIAGRLSVGFQATTLAAI